MTPCTTPTDHELSPIAMIGTAQWKEAVPLALQRPLAMALRATEERRTGDALHWFGVCAEIDPFSRPVLYFGGQVAGAAYFALRGRDDVDEATIEQWKGVAETLMRAAHEIAPDDAVAAHNLAKFLQDTGDDRAATAYYEHALAIDPSQTESWGNLGTARYQLGDVTGGWEAWRACLATEPKNPSGSLNQSFIHLREGRWAHGWALFAERWRELAFLRDYGRQQDFGTAIHWTGQPLRRRDTMLVHGEQGLGDHVQFARWIDRMREYRVSGIETRPVLKRWMQGCFPDIPVYARGYDEVPPHTYHVSMLDLPHVLGTEIPGPGAPAVEPRRLVTDGTVPIGIAWQGAKGNTADAMRSIPTELLGALADIPNVTWVSLQFTPDAGMYARSWLGARVMDAAAEPADALDTARIIAGLAHVFTVDTLTAHLAGSLGVPTTILHRFCREWRWGESGESNVWYPSARSWTVAAPNAWAPLLERVRTETTRLGALHG